MPLNPHNRLLVALLLFLHLWGWPDASRDEGGGGPNAHNQKRAANGQPVYSKHGAGSPAFGNIPVEFCPAPGADVCIESKFSMLVSSDTCILTRCSFVWLLPLCQMFGPGGIRPKNKVAMSLVPGHGSRKTRLYPIRRCVWKEGAAIGPKGR